jgi:hypothetical protein
MGTINSCQAAIDARALHQWQRRPCGMYLHNGRNECVQSMLDDHVPNTDEPFTHLLFIDSDMKFTPEDIVKVIDPCSEANPVVGGMYRNPVSAERDIQTGLPTLAPVAYMLETGTDDAYGYINIDPKFWGDDLSWFDPDDPPDPTHPYLKVDAVGTGFMAIHRSLLELMANKYPQPTPWFCQPDFGDPPKNIGEDLGFCMRVGVDLGFPIFLARCARIGHYKEMLI